MIAVELIRDRLRALLSDRAVAVPSEALDRIRELETQLARANERLIMEGTARERLDVELPALATAVAECSTRFDELVAEARAEVPPGAQAHVADLEKRLAAAQTDAVAARTERDDAVRTCEALALLRDAVLRWDADSYSPRLKNAIAAFRRQEVGRR